MKLETPTLFYLSELKLFEWFILANIFGTCIVLALTDPNPNHQHSQMNKNLNKAEVIFSIVFTLEVSIFTRFFYIRNHFIRNQTLQGPAIKKLKPGSDGRQERALPKSKKLLVYETKNWQTFFEFYGIFAKIKKLLKNFQPSEREHF